MRALDEFAELGVEADDEIEHAPVQLDLDAHQVAPPLRQLDDAFLDQRARRIEIGPAVRATLTSAHTRRTQAHTHTRDDEEGMRAWP